MNHYSGSFPLLRHFDAATPLAYVAERTVSAQEFLLHASALAARLPKAKYVINLCEDRYDFLLGFAAALLRQQITLLPSSRASGTLRQIATDYEDSYYLSDQTFPAGISGFNCRSVLAPEADDTAAFVIPTIAADQIAAILFTSGSTGEPTAHAKTWGMWVRGADQLQSAFAPAIGSGIIGTIAPQHMFGMESTIIYPLQWGCVIHHARPHLPADIEQAVSEIQPAVWLMTTPLHLRACITEDKSIPGIAGTISATMPLDLSSALAAEKLFDSTLYEIYGCTEAGMIATRRPVQNEKWQLCADFQLRHEADRMWLEGPRANPACMLSDRILQHDAQHFSLLGRLTDMIKIAGKRTSLNKLNTALLAIDGITDGVFFQADSGNSDTHTEQRLSAFFVSDQLSSAQVITALRLQIDPVFMPRPIFKLERLPRDANGKLSLAALTECPRLASQVSSAKDINTLRHVGIVPSGHAALPGHFPGKPIVPGLLLLSEVVRIANTCVTISGVKQVKFHIPLKPDQEYVISFSSSNAQTLKFSLHHGQALIANGLLQMKGTEHA
ncbi:Tyrocidine synthase 1 [compost metagenome]